MRQRLFVTVYLLGAAFTTALFSLFAPLAAAQGYVDICYGDEGRQTPARVIEACTALRLSGQFTRREEAIIYVLRGRAYLGQDDYANAIADFGRAIKINPKFASAYAYRASAYAEMKDYARAIEDADKAASLEPASAGYQNNRCALRAMAGQDLSAVSPACTVR